MRTILLLAIGVVAVGWLYDKYQHQTKQPTSLSKTGQEIDPAVLKTSGNAMTSGNIMTTGGLTTSGNDAYAG